VRAQGDASRRTRRGGHRDVIRGRYRGLRGRFLLLVVAVFVLVGAASLFAFYRVADGIIHGLGTGYASQYAKQQRSRILAKVERELVLAQKLADSPLLKAWCADEHDAALRRAALAELESYRRLFADHSVFFIVDATRDYYFNNAANEFAGRELRYQLKEGEQESAWYFETMKQVDAFDLHVDNSAQLDLTKLWINVIVRDGARKCGLGGSGLDLSAFLRDVVHNTDPGVETVLVDGGGFLQAEADAGLMEANARIRDESRRMTVFGMLDREDERAELRSLLGRMQAGAIPDARIDLSVGGRRRIAAVSWLPEIRWAAIALVDPAEVVRLETFRPIVVLMAVALLATILLVSWLLDRLVLTRLARLTDLAEDIAAGHYERRLAVDRDDEIGQLTRSFNAMTDTIGDYMQNLEQKVAQRTDELQRANALLESTNRKVMDSIGYARLIQSSILSKADDLEALSSDHAVLWLPRDVVGGDFHCVYRDGQGGFLVTVADCTGHGVPGAFMTMASKALLDRAVAARGLADPGALVGDLHRGLRALLQSRYAGDADNGLDIGLLYLPPQRDRVVYAGARLALWQVAPDGGVTVAKGDRRSAGYRRIPDDASYANVELAARPGQRFVLSTDGLFDQNGGERGFAFAQSGLARVLAAHAGRSLAGLPEELTRRLDAWRGDLPQRDDITLFAFTLVR